MIHKVCTYNNKIFVALDTYITAYSCKKYLRSQDEKFQESFKIKIPVKFLYIKDIRIYVIDDYITGLKSLLILISNFDGLCNAFTFCNAFKKQLYEIMLPQTGDVWIVNDDNHEYYHSNIFVSDGPTFLYYSVNVFHIYSVPYSINESFDRQLFSTKDDKILQFKCFGPFDNKTNHRFFSLLVLSCSSLNKQILKFVGFVLEKCNQTIHCGQLNTSLFFPQCYESVLKAVEVLKLIPDFKVQSVDVEDLELYETMCVICTTNDCLVFTNAVLKYCCQLSVPLLDIMCMKTEFSRTFKDSENLVLLFENKTVVFIKVVKDINCQIVKQWTDIEIAITGDILLKGTKQILLATNKDSWQNNCFLYDMLSFMPVDMLSRSVVPDICLKATISGLQKKVLVGLSAIKDIEQEISQKSAATIDALLKLGKVSMHIDCLKQSHIFQESLIDLILSKDENKAGCIPQESESSVKLLNKKEQFLDNQWFLCLNFLNEGKRSICNPSIKVLLRDSEVACIQKLFVHSSDSSFIYGEYSRQINSLEKFSIIISFKFSLLYAEDEIFMILTWYNGSEDEFDNEILATEVEKVLTQHQFCFQTRISLDEVLNYQMKRDIASPEDLLVAKATRQRIGLTVSSLHSNISRLEHVIMNRSMDFANLCLFESSSKTCIAFNNEKSLLFGAHLVLENCRQNRAEIEAFVKNEKEICLLIHYLYQNLPEDVTIFPCLTFEDELLRLKKKAVISMKAEIDLIISSLNIYNISEELRKNYPKLMSSQKVGTISIPKEIYQRIRTALVKKECVTDTMIQCIVSDLF